MFLPFLCDEAVDRIGQPSSEHLLAPAAEKSVETPSVGMSARGLTIWFRDCAGHGSPRLTQLVRSATEFADNFSPGGIF